MSNGSNNKPTKKPDEIKVKPIASPNSNGFREPTSLDKPNDEKK